MTGHVVKWAGNKRKRRADLAALLRGTSGVYCEPFLGSANVYLELVDQGIVLPRQAVLGDACLPLVATYRAVVRNPAEVARRLGQLPQTVEAAAAVAEEHGLACSGQSRAPTPWGAYFEHVRARVNAQDLEPGATAPAGFAADLIWLNRASINGLWRVNRRGQNNAARADRICGLPDEQRLSAFSAALDGAILLDGDWRRTLDVARALAASAGGRVFVDPPYLGLYAGYQAGGFAEEENTIHLPRALGQLASDGWVVVATNADRQELRDAYLAEGLDARAVVGETTISRDPASRGAQKELLLTSRGLPGMER